MGSVRNIRERESNFRQNYDFLPRNTKSHTTTVHHFELHRPNWPTSHRQNHRSPTYRTPYPRQSPSPVGGEKRISTLKAPVLDDDGFTIVRRKKRALDKQQQRATGCHRGQCLEALGSRPLVSHRGQSRHQWWRGPRELHRSGTDEVSLFVDGIPKRLALAELRKMFEEAGIVSDVYISGKKRLNKNVNFAFVRYRSVMEAKKAIQLLDGKDVYGNKLGVSMAKFQKKDFPIDKGGPSIKHTKVVKNREFKQSFRDQRRYSDVIMGAQREPSSSKQMVADTIPNR
ncbi:unnamed protein product [Amaranthus hypochondriacus]